MINHVIKALSTKSCPLDPMPAQLLKDHLDLIVPVVTDIVNESLSTGVFPTCLKHSLIRPLLKKQDLDRENLKNYRPIANIPFLSKVIEKAVVFQINLYLETNKLFPLLQSAYRKHHSTETALLRVLDGILMSLDLPQAQTQCTCSSFTGQFGYIPLAPCWQSQAQLPGDLLCCLHVLFCVSY